MQDWTLTDWSEGTKGLDSLMARSRRYQGTWILVTGSFAIGMSACLWTVLLLDSTRYELLLTMFLAQAPWAAIFGRMLATSLPDLHDSNNLAELQADLPASVGQFPVTVRYSEAGVDLGMDRGFVMFAGGFMFFQGARSRFSIGRKLGIWVTPSAPETSNGWSLEYRASSPMRGISLNPDSSFPGFGSGLLSAFQDEFERWQLQGDESVNEAILPPTRPHREFVKRAGLAALGFTGLSVWMMIASAMAFLCWQRFSFAQGVELVFGCYVIAFGWCAAAALTWRNRWSLLRTRAKSERYADGYGGVTLPRDHLNTPGERLSPQARGEPEGLRLGL